MTTDTPAPVELIDDAEDTLSRLERMCCAPDRSPQMAAIGDSLTSIRSAVSALDGSEDAVTTLIARLESTGSQIGTLQVGCCAPARMPLYSKLLTSLTEIQRAAKAQIGQGH